MSIIIDDETARRFVGGDVTSKYMREIMAKQLEEHGVRYDDNMESTTDLLRRMLKETMDGKIRVSQWEMGLLSDNKDKTDQELTEKQKAKILALWQRFKLMARR